MLYISNFQLVFYLEKTKIGILHCGNKILIHLVPYSHQTKLNDSRPTFQIVLQLLDATSFV